MSNLAIAAMIAVLGFTAACRSDVPRGPVAADADAQGHVAPSAHTRARNAAVGATLPLDDRRDFEDAERGLLLRDDAVTILRADGSAALWDTSPYDFLVGEAPDSVHPSLWRQAQLSRIHGLFEVAPGVVQVRGYDLGNLTLIEGRSGWIVVDPLTARETAAAAFELARRHFGDRPVAALIYTHSHVDHFGGVEGIISAEEAGRRAIPIIAPAGFTEEATRENVLAGTVMARRAAYMYGVPLARGPRGHVSTGLGVEPARGEIGLLLPNQIVDTTPQRIQVDGIEFVFQYVPDSEAPAEMTFYLPHVRAFCGAEIVSHTLHNVYTPRGAKIRDALRWSAYIDEAMALFPDMEVAFASHHWPVWGNQRALRYLAGQRDTYKFIHDQTLRLAAAGRTPREIAEEIELPDSLAQEFANRDYYGTVRHNAKGVYQAYFGWYDGNPANLDPLPPAEAGSRYVAAMGGADQVRRLAAEAYERGEYRWVATLLDHLVASDSRDREARELLARAYDQLGYQAESGPWRDIYLTGAHELRHGVQPAPNTIRDAGGLLRRVPIDQFLRAMAASLNGTRARTHVLTINLVISDRNESFVLRVENSVLHARPGAPSDEADATLRATHDSFLRLITRQLGWREALLSDDIRVEGSRLKLLRFFSLLDPPSEDFAIATRD